MKKFGIMIILCAIICACSNSKEEPTIDFNISITTEEPINISIDGASIIINLNYTGIQVKESGIEIYEGTTLINTLETNKTGNKFTFDISSLTPDSPYSVRSFVKYIDPNTKEEKTTYGNIVSFKTLMPIIEISSLNKGTNIVNGTVFGYSDGKCSVEITSNFETSNKIKFVVSTDKTFENICLVKEIYGKQDPTTINFNLEQGKYYGQCIGTVNGLVINSNIVEYYVITQSGTVVSEGYVDLGFDYLWSATYYSEPKENSQYPQFRFPVSTIDDFEGIHLDNDNFSGTQYDYITSVLGKPNRLPTFTEFQNLLTACLVEYNDSEIKISGCTGNAISIPMYFENNYNYISSYYFGTGTINGPSMDWSFHYSSSGLGEWPYENLNHVFIIYPVKDKE